ncbi:unnamed protein product [Acanthoscelides obtectus]|uniref:Uncharacterized protein n=1 Tax=Acanthoscelides obtectus TaxID=200917 RepID=A0A9P0LEW9_ACAOB|nr:unnamed protein product [Acanthoscelides obtectus]CAK1650257.1 hypothetical protein AOBTE_LOCUS16718 [Acanthoscelides obtectus]
MYIIIRLSPQLNIRRLKKFRSVCLRKYIRNLNISNSIFTIKLQNIKSAIFDNGSISSIANSDRGSNCSRAKNKGS